MPTTAHRSLPWGDGERTTLGRSARLVLLSVLRVMRSGSLREIGRNRPGLPLLDAMFSWLNDVLYFDRTSDACDRQHTICDASGPAEGEGGRRRSSVSHPESDPEFRPV